MNWFYWDTVWSRFFATIAFMTIVGHPEAVVVASHTADPAAVAKRLLKPAIFLSILLAFALAALSATESRARDLDGRYANSPLHEWFNQLKSGKGLCCSFADGATVEDPDWNISDGHYRVRIDANWYDVPDDAVIVEPNRLGKTMVWPFYSDGKLLYIRCFMPGDLG
jgi:hypothetical protein